MAAGPVNRQALRVSPVFTPAVIDDIQEKAELAATGSAASGRFAIGRSRPLTI